MKECVRFIERIDDVELEEGERLDGSLLYGNELRSR